VIIPDVEGGEDAAEVADFAFKWFQLHADQRLKVFNFFLVIAGICVAGFFTAIQAKNAVAASLISIVLIVVCICFKQLDLRTAQLVEIGEDYLREWLELKNKKLDSANVNLIARADVKRNCLSYRQVFNLLFIIFGLVGLLGAIFPWISPTILGILL
jgi:hypothetical protein